MWSTLQALIFPSVHAEDFGGFWDSNIYGTFLRRGKIRNFLESVDKRNIENASCFQFCLLKPHPRTLLRIPALEGNKMLGLCFLICKEEIPLSTPPTNQLQKKDRRINRSMLLKPVGSLPGRHVILMQFYYRHLPKSFPILLGRM
jgi:hypothetical protein